MTNAERQHLDRVASLGCIACARSGMGYTPAGIHHIQQGSAFGKRASNFETIPLCNAHHQHGGYGVAYHAGAKVWQKKFGSERELLREVREMLRAS